MANEQNLRPASQQTAAERRENGRKGGLAAAQNKRRRRKLQEIAQTMGEAVTDEGLTHDEKAVLALLRKAEQGDARAAELYFRLRTGAFDLAAARGKAEIRLINAKTKDVDW